MNCKNCKSEITEIDNFCNNCGAKVIKERITVKSLFSNLLISLGWDSNFFITLRYLIYKPQIVINEYINGTRKKYANPFTFFAIGIAFSLFVFNQYSKQFVKLSAETNTKQSETTANFLSKIIGNPKKTIEFDYEKQYENQKIVTEKTLKYYNLISFLLLPFYALIAFIVFRKPYNYGEHLVINTYIQGILLFLSIILFIFSLLTKFNLFSSGIYILPFLYYPFVYKKLNKYTIGQTLLKILKFIGVLLLVIIISILIGFVLAMIKSKF